MNEFEEIKTFFAESIHNFLNFGLQLGVAAIESGILPDTVYNAPIVGMEAIQTMKKLLIKSLDIKDNDNLKNQFDKYVQHIDLAHFTWVFGDGSNQHGGMPAAVTLTRPQSARPQSAFRQVLPQSGSRQALPSVSWQSGQLQQPAFRRDYPMLYPQQFSHLAPNSLEARSANPTSNDYTSHISKEMLTEETVFSGGLEFLSTINFDTVLDNISILSQYLDDDDTISDDSSSLYADDPEVNALISDMEEYMSIMKIVSPKQEALSAGGSPASRSSTWKGGVAVLEGVAVCAICALLGSMKI